MRCSVLINTYNHGAFIEDCVQSVFAQTRPAEEIIVYDDGSTDDTVVRLRRHAERLMLLAGEHQPLPAWECQGRAIHAAFARSTGDLVFLLDGDDRFHPEKIARYAEAFARHPQAALIQAPMTYVDAAGRALGVHHDPRRHLTRRREDVYRRHDLDFYYFTSALAFSRDYLLRILPLDFRDGLRLWSDARLGMLAPHFGEIVTLDEPLTDWRRHSASDSLSAPPRHRLRQTLYRHRVFNDYGRRHGHPPLRLWRNRRFYGQLLRFLLPAACYNLYQRWARPSSGAATAPPSQEP